LLKPLVEGHNYKTAAKEVGTTVRAVSFHMQSIYEKLEVHSKSEAVAKALRDRIVTQVPNQSSTTSIVVVPGAAKVVAKSHSIL